MIIDTSALVAVLDQEPEAERIVRTLASAPERTLSAATLVEEGIVMQARRGDDGARDLDLLLAKLRVDIAAVTASRRYRAQGTPTPFNLDKMFLASLANRVTRHQAQRFGITSKTRKHNGVTGHV